MHDKHKVLLFRLSDLTREELQNLHCANEYYWRPEPGKVAGRPLLDCSNAPPGVILLNSDFTRLREIERYQQVTLPTFRKIIHDLDRYRRDNHLQWSDTCHGMLQPVILGPGHVLMLTLTCGFGAGVTPMIWSEVGDLMNRTANLCTRIKTFTYVDNFLGGGMQDYIRHAASVVHEIIRGILGPTGLSERKIRTHRLPTYLESYY